MDWDELEKDVTANGNVKTYNMAVLREAHEVGRLGKHVVLAITKELAAKGLGHVPENLSHYHQDPVRLYKKGTPIGDLIDLEGERNAKLGG